MNPELDNIALRYAGKLFPDFLFIIENTRDYNFVKSNINIFNDKLIYDYIINDYKLKNLNSEQTEYIFKIIEIKYSKFLQKKWFEFNSITKKIYRQDDKSILPDDLHFLNDKNYIELIKNNIEANKLKLIDNYKKIREYIFIKRPKEIHLQNDLLFNIYNYITNTKEYTEEEINEYLQKWIDLTVTLYEWQQHKNINLDEELEHFGLEDETLQEIMQHKFKLFNELKNRIFKNTLAEPFNKIFPIEDKTIVAKRDLALIENLIDGNIDEIKSKRLYEVLHIKNWKITATHFDHIFRHKYKSEANYDIHDADSFLDAHVIIEYKKHLENYLTNTKEEIINNENKSDKTEETILSEEKMNYILKLLEDLEITSNGIYILGEKKKSSIRGVVEALRKNNLIPNIGLEKLNKMIADRINLDLKSKLDVSDTSKLYKKLALEILDKK